MAKKACSSARTIELANNPGLPNLPLLPPIHPVTNLLLPFLECTGHRIGLSQFPMLSRWFDRPAPNHMCSVLLYKISDASNLGFEEGNDWLYLFHWHCSMRRVRRFAPECKAICMNYSVVDFEIGAIYCDSVEFHAVFFYQTFAVN